MKIGRTKYVDGLQEIGHDEKQLEKAEFVRATAKNLTMLDIIGLVVLTMFQPALNLAQLTGDDSLRQKLEDEQETLDK